MRCGLFFSNARPAELAQRVQSQEQSKELPRPAASQGHFSVGGTFCKINFRNALPPETARHALKQQPTGR
jgi:hypothetical protein